MYIWNYVAQIFMIRYWDDAYRTVPVFSKELAGDKLAKFDHTPEGFNCIILSSNQGLTDREMMGVLLHELCHHVAFEKHGWDIESHGEEWKAEMLRVGFENPCEATDGMNFFSEREYHETMDLVEGI